MAIEPQVLIACRARDDAKVDIRSNAFPGTTAEFSLDRRIEPGEPTWANYSRGVTAELIGAGIPLVGMDALITNSLPVGSGLSSSAALEVGTARALLALAGTALDDSRLALLCQKAEHDFAKVPVGIMDQTIVAAARAGHAMLLDCRDLSRRFVPIDSNELRVVIVNSMVKHALTDGGYAQRRRECEEATAFFHGKNATVRASRCLGRTSRCSAGPIAGCCLPSGQACRNRECPHFSRAQLLAQRNYDELGQLMVKSHQSLRDDYNVSCPELDFLAENAMTTKGVYGARMTGGGFGGCIVALVQPRSVETLGEHLRKSYAAQFGIEPQVFATNATAGANQIEPVQTPSA